MKKGWATGKELRTYLEHELELVFSHDPWKLSGGWGPRHSGMSMIFSAYAPPGERLRELRIGGRPIDDGAKYSLAGCERDGEPLDVVCRMKNVHAPEVLPMSIHAALRAYLAKHPVIAPRREGRSIATDLPRTVFSQEALLEAAPKPAAR
jgi:hypothetical protein